MHIAALRHTWPVALLLFGVRLLSLWLGNEIGCLIAGSSIEHRRLGDFSTPLASEWWTSVVHAPKWVES